MVWLPRNEKQTYRLNSRPQTWPMGLTLTITLTFEFWRSNVTLTFDHTQWPRPWIFMVKFWYSCISEWEGRLTLHKGSGSRSFMTMTMTMTIWWPRSGVWIYQIVTGVTSVVGVPSTHLVVIIYLHWRIEDETKWLPFSRCHFQIHFLERKCINFYERKIYASTFYHLSYCLDSLELESFICVSTVGKAWCWAIVYWNRQ